ncbi:uncharacterized protein [Epargyreus clarus]|uniref:uncharacterized protein n=1 Tax=Epargyreus clarus TaxID=520877 RepID=UPI003C2AB159
MSSATDEVAESEFTNVTIRRPISSNFNCETCNTSQNFVLRTEITSIVRDELRTIIRNIFDEEFAKIRTQMQGFQESITYITGQFDKAVSDINLCTEAVKQLQTENTCLKNKISDLESRLSQVEQDARQSNIEIHCLPEHRQENLLNTITQLCKVVSFPLSENDILSCNRVQKLNSSSKKPRTVVCKLTNRLKRDNLLAAVLTFNKTNPKQKLSTKHLGYGDMESPVYVCEHLTPQNKILHAATRIRAKEKQYKFVWIRNGKIFVRKDETSPALVITHHDSIHKLIQ